MGRLFSLISALTAPQKVDPLFHCLGCLSCTFPLFLPPPPPSPLTSLTPSLRLTSLSSFHSFPLSVKTRSAEHAPSFTSPINRSRSLARSRSCSLAPLFVSSSHLWRRHGGRRSSIRGGGAGQEGYLPLKRQHLPSQQSLVCVVALRTGRSAPRMLGIRAPHAFGIRGAYAEHSGLDPRRAAAKMGAPALRLRHRTPVACKLLAS